ncbi:hypothetical protein NQZ68_001771 [Dissostichus eleginoides]|nr:hypothetical protein NQZ68_001771 [Dissostichus eleginoides]
MPDDLHHECACYICCQEQACSFLALLMAAPQLGHVTDRASWEQLGVRTCARKRRDTSGNSLKHMQIREETNHLVAVGDAAAAPVAKEKAAGCLNNNGRLVNIPTFQPPSTPLLSIIPLLSSPSLHPLEVKGRSFLSTVRLKPAATSPVGGEGEKENEQNGEDVLLLCPACNCPDNSAQLGCRDGKPAAGRMLTGTLGVSYAARALTKGERESVGSRWMLELLRCQRWLARRSVTLLRSSPGSRSRCSRQHVPFI